MQFAHERNSHHLQAASWGLSKRVQRLHFQWSVIEREAMVRLPCLCTAEAPQAGCALPLASGAEISRKSLRNSSNSESQSLFNFESQIKPPQYEGVIHRPTLYRGFTGSPGPIWWKPWAGTSHQRRGAVLQLVTAMATIASRAFVPTSALSWMHERRCGIPPDRQAFRFQLLVISKVFSFLLFNTKNHVIVNGDSRISHGENGPE